MSRVSFDLPRKIGKRIPLPDFSRRLKETLLAGKSLRNLDALSQRRQVKTVKQLQLPAITKV